MWGGGSDAGFGIATVTTDFSEISAGGAPGRTEESFRSGGNGGVSRCANAGWTAKGRGGDTSCEGGDAGLGSAVRVCDGRGCGVSATGGGRGCGVGGVLAIAIGPCGRGGLPLSGGVRGGRAPGSRWCRCA